MADNDASKALIQEAVTTFGFTPEDTEALAQALYRANITLATLLHVHVAQATSQPVPLHWQLPTEALHTLAEDAWQTARGIVDTYQTDLHWQAEGFVEAWEGAHDGLDGCKSALSTQLQHWATSRADWKSEQIARVESANALKYALDAYLKQGQPTRAVDPDVPLVLVVLPFDAKEPFCQALTSMIWPISAWVWLFSVLPAHGGCPHFAFPVSPADLGLGDDDVLDEDNDEEEA